MVRIVASVFRVKSRRYKSCIELAKIHLFKHPKVCGVKIIGYYMIIHHEPNIEPEKILEEISVTKYYMSTKIKSNNLKKINDQEPYYKLR
ncbi:MAG: hypothetical protein B6U89_06535 [Desulfurococcales archaeon ex4484_58]|nr:MAG: hypothetical protein B6U89_06535 [Desulfurococcales archaeon ex4484_58]